MSDCWEAVPDKRPTFEELAYATDEILQNAMKMSDMQSRSSSTRVSDKKKRESRSGRRAGSGEKRLFLCSFVFIMSKPERCCVAWRMWWQNRSMSFVYRLLFVQCFLLITRFPLSKKFVFACMT